MEKKVNDACVRFFIFARFGAQTKNRNDSCYQQGISRKIIGVQNLLKGNLISRDFLTKHRILTYMKTCVEVVGILNSSFGA